MNLHELAAIASDENKAIGLIEKLRWPDGAICPHCGSDRSYKLTGKSTRAGLRKCGACRKQYTVRVGTIFEDSPIPLGKWILAIHLMCSSKKGISANQIKRELSISYQSAWFLCHRIREAMKLEPMASILGSGGGIVEIDETFVGGKKSNNLHRNKTKEAGKKTAVLTLIDREGSAVTMKVPNTKKKTLQSIIKPIVDHSATIMTDANPSYEGLDDHFAAHHAVDHGKHFVRAVILHTNFAESYHSLFKRGLMGAFHHISEKHMERYLREFECRWNTRKMTDGDRMNVVIKSTEGKRLMYKHPVNREITN